MPETLKELGQQLKALRLKSKMTLTELEQKTGIPNGNLSLIERGKSISIKTLEKILNAYDKKVVFKFVKK